jgi:hypothetical protein
VVFSAWSVNDDYEGKGIVNGLWLLAPNLLLSSAFFILQTYYFSLNYLSSCCQDVVRATSGELFFNAFRDFSKKKKIHKRQGFISQLSI